MTFGEYIRKLREEKQMLLREVAAKMNVDTALLSKIERGTRVARKEQVEALALSLQVNREELIIMWMAEKIASMLKEVDNREEILKIAEEKVKYLTHKTKS